MKNNKKEKCKPVSLEEYNKKAKELAKRTQSEIVYTTKSPLLLNEGTYIHSIVTRIKHEVYKYVMISYSKSKKGTKRYSQIKVSSKKDLNSIENLLLRTGRLSSINRINMILIL